MNDRFGANIDHIKDEFKRLDIMIHLQVLLFRHCSKNEFSGLYISEEEINGILDGAPIESDILTEDLIDRLQKMRFEIEDKKQRSLDQGVFLSLPSLAQTFALSPFETDALLICVAPELDSKYEKLYAYLNDDITRKRPTAGLVLDLLCSSWEEKLKARKYLDGSGSLFKCGLMKFAEERAEMAMLSRALAVDAGVISFIAGDGKRSARIGGEDEFSDRNPIASAPRDDFAFISDDVMARAASFAEHLKKTWKNFTKRAICCLQGPYGSGKLAVVRTICSNLGANCSEIDLVGLALGETDFESSIRSAFRDAAMNGSALCLDHFETLDGMNEEDDANSLKGADQNFTRKIAVIKALGSFSGLVFILTQKPLDLGKSLQRDLFTIEMLLPGYSDRKQIWERSLDGRICSADAGDLASRFGFTQGQIQDAVAAARNLASLDGRDEISIGDLYRGCRSQSSRRLSALATKIKPHYAMKDIKLPKDRIRQLEEIRNHIKYKGQVYDEWGFQKKLSLGRGLNILFSGPSGTGKTMAAGILAKELNLDLYKIDLSAVVSKYIGETEKNLSRIFREAEQSNAILFFDEADAIFGKRSEVRDSHDRYANIEIGYLLQKMEEHSGVVILASNLSQNIDDAFMRRMQFVVDFPFPDEKQRLCIWKSLFPEMAPLDEEMDFDFLSKKFKLAGGNIKNIIVNAAFLAADDSGIIAMEHIIMATKREYQKIGRICTPSDFGKYYEIVSGD